MEIIRAKIHHHLYLELVHGSVTQAYGVNRADRSFIPGGSVSGTGIIRPDFPELKEWPYFWQQTEYVLGGGSFQFYVFGTCCERCTEIIMDSKRKRERVKSNRFHSFPFRNYI